MLRRYELTDDEWNRIVDLLPPENTVNRAAHEKITVPLSTEWCGSLAVVSMAATCPERCGPWETVYSRFLQMDRGWHLG